VGQREAHRDVALTAAGELGPVPADRGVQVERAPLDQQRDAHGGHALRARVDALQVVGGDVIAAPQVNDPLAAQVGAELAAGVALLGEQPPELGGDRLEPGAVVP